MYAEICVCFAEKWPHTHTQTHKSCRTRLLPIFWFLFQVNWSRTALRLVINWTLTEMEFFSTHILPHNTHTHMHTTACTCIHTAFQLPGVLRRLAAERVDNDTSHTKTCKWTACTWAQTPTIAHARLTEAHIPRGITYEFHGALWHFRVFTVWPNAFWVWGTFIIDITQQQSKSTAVTQIYICVLFKLKKWAKERGKNKIQISH